MASYKLSPKLPGTGDLTVGDPAHRGASWVYMGTLAEGGPLRRLRLDVTAEHVIAMLGKRGTGKSYTLGVLLEGLASSPANSSIASLARQRGVLVLDILDIFWSTAIPLKAGGPPELERQYQRLVTERLQPAGVSVDVWIPAGFQRPDIDLPQTKVFRVKASDLTAEDWAVLFEFDLLTEPRGMLVEELVRKTAVTGWTDLLGAHHPAVPDFTVTNLIECLENDAAISTAYLDGTKRAVSQRLNSAAINPLFQGAPTPLTDLFSEGRAAVLMLGRLPDSAKQLVAAFILRQVMRDRQVSSFASKRLDLGAELPDSERAALERQVKESIPRSWVLVDEAQVLVPAGTKTLCGEMLIRYAKEGRNFGLSMAVTTQQPAALSERLMSQVETMFVHQLTTKSDLDVALKSLKSPQPEDVLLGDQESSLEDLVRSLPQGTALFSSANGGEAMPRAAVVRIRPRVTGHGGYEA